MNRKTFIIKSLRRFQSDQPPETLEFKPGVNLIVGEKDTGKTKWLSMLDFLLGDNGSPEDAFGIDLAAKYDCVSANLVFSDGSEATIERKWKIPGIRGKIFVNDLPMDADDFSDFLLNALDIPRIRFPRGNPWNDRTWPKLTWRILLRSIYRQERFWSDFVDRQPEAEQAAALLQFLGFADKQFPQSYEELIQNIKALQQFEGQRDAFSAILHSVITELVQQNELTVAVTRESVNRTKQKLDHELAVLADERDELLKRIVQNRKVANPSRFESLKSDRDRAALEYQQLVSEQEKGCQRLKELVGNQESVEVEISRLKRTRTAGTHLVDFKVTHCPVCEQPANEPQETSEFCYLCGKKLDSSDVAASNARIEFEIDQLEEELEELHELIGKTRKDVEANTKSLDIVANRIKKLETTLAPAVRLAAEVLPPDLSIIDINIGRLNEQLEQISRIERNLDRQDKLEEQIKNLTAKIEALSADQSLRNQEVDFKALSQVLENGMNSYLNALNSTEQNRWMKGKLSVKLNDRSFAVTIKDADLEGQVGATSKAIVLFSYHYVLLSLSSDPTRNYPGIVIVDFPLTLAEGDRLIDAENYLVEPFISLCSQPGMEHTQFIAAGRTFERLDHVNQIKLGQSY
jgi:hypothetical protein